MNEVVKAMKEGQDEKREETVEDVKSASRRQAAIASRWEVAILALASFPKRKAGLGDFGLHVLAAFGKRVMQYYT